MIKNSLKLKIIKNKAKYRMMMTKNKVYPLSIKMKQKRMKIAKMTT
jgi:hypothetical protein